VFATALAVLTAELRQAITPRLSNQPTQDRARYLLSPIIFPTEQPPPRSSPNNPRPLSVPTSSARHRML
jgi:hypothetical protein